MVNATLENTQTETCEDVFMTGSQIQREWFFASRFMRKSDSEESETLIVQWNGHAWHYKMGFRYAHDSWYALYVNPRTYECAVNIHCLMEPDRVWTGERMPNLGVYSSFSECIRGLAEQHAT